jgi:hypothetical protein
LIVFAQAIPAAIFGFAMGFFTFIGSTIPPLGFTVIFSFSRDSAWITAVYLSSEASPTDTKSQSAPSAVNFDQ